MDLDTKAMHLDQISKSLDFGSHLHKNDLQFPFTLLFFPFSTLTSTFLLYFTCLFNFLSNYFYLTFFLFYPRRWDSNRGPLAYQL